MRILLVIMLQRGVCLLAVDRMPASKAPQLTQQLADVVASVRSAVMTVTMRLPCLTHRAEDKLAAVLRRARVRQDFPNYLPTG